MLFRRGIKGVAAHFVCEIQERTRIYSIFEKKIMSEVVVWPLVEATESNEPVLFGIPSRQKSQSRGYATCLANVRPAFLRLFGESVHLVRIKTAVSESKSDPVPVNA
jgi:predicted short-subunit dehydrogenase-like oxidoreductase (DUF2520 family)